jgi:hypothetical protein
MEWPMQRWVLRDAMKEVCCLTSEDMLRNVGPEWLLAVLDSREGR